MREPQSSTETSICWAQINLLHSQPHTRRLSCSYRQLSYSSRLAAASVMQLSATVKQPSCCVYHTTATMSTIASTSAAERGTSKHQTQCGAGCTGAKVTEAEKQVYWKQRQIMKDQSAGSLEIWSKKRGCNEVVEVSPYSDHQHRCSH